MLDKTLVLQSVELHLRSNPEIITANAPFTITELRVSDNELRLTVRITSSDRDLVLGLSYTEMDNPTPWRLRQLPEEDIVRRFQNRSSSDIADEIFAYLKRRSLRSRC